MSEEPRVPVDPDLNDLASQGRLEQVDAAVYSVARHVDTIEQLLKKMGDDLRKTPDKLAEQVSPVTFVPPTA